MSLACGSSIKGDYVVEATLEALGLLDPPSMIMNGSLEGVRVTEEGRGELNELVGTYRAPDTSDAFSRTTRAHQNGLVYGWDRFNTAVHEVEPGELPTAEGGRLIDDRSDESVWSAATPS